MYNWMLWEQISLINLINITPGVSLNLRELEGSQFPVPVHVRWHEMTVQLVLSEVFINNSLEKACGFSL